MQAVTPVQTAEMPARAEEVKHAKEEGIIFRMLTNPVELIGDGPGGGGTDLGDVAVSRVRVHEPQDVRDSVGPALVRVAGGGVADAGGKAVADDAEPAPVYRT